MLFISYKTSTPSINYAEICKSCFLVEIVSLFYFLGGRIVDWVAWLVSVGTPVPQWGNEGG